MKNTYIPNFKLQKILDESIIITQNDIHNEFIKRNSEFTVTGIYINSSQPGQETLKPSEEEIQRYLPYLKSHIEIINPKILVLLGSTALNTLIGNEVVISKARGKWIQKEIGTIKPWIIASFHPAFLMRQPEQKKLAWIDLKMIREKYKILKI